MTEPRITRVKIEKLTEEAFAPFGEILGPKDCPPSAISPSGGTAWFSDFSADGTVRVAFSSKPYYKSPTDFLCYTPEQHRDVKQTMILLEGRPGVLLVAPPTPWRTKPEIDRFRAFLLDGTRGVVMHKLTWHNSGVDGSTSVFPLYPPALNSIVIHCAETWDCEINQTFELTHRVDLKDEFGVAIQLTW